MFCKSMKNDKFFVTLVVVGSITLIFGILGNIRITGNAGNLNRLMGMFSGLGCAFIGIGSVKLIHNRRTSVAKLKQEEIELKDERNIQILRIAYSVANTIATVLFALMAFLFTFLNYIIPAFISIGALYIQLLGFFISYKYFKRKM